MPEPGRIYQCHNRTDRRPWPSIVWAADPVLSIFKTPGTLDPKFFSKTCEGSLNLQIQTQLPNAVANIAL